MDGETFRSRVVNLVSRSRKALRLYSNVGRFHGDSSHEYAGSQTEEWKSVTADLLRDLNTALELSRSVRELSQHIHTIRDRFNSQWRALEAEINPKHRDLIMSAEGGDFVKSSLLSAELVRLKARMQAAQAAHHELHDVLRRSKINRSTIELTGELTGSPALHDRSSADSVVRESTQIGIEEPQITSAKVIPIRKIL